MKIVKPIDVTDEVLIDSSIPMPDVARGEIEWQPETGRTFRSPLMPMSEVGALWDCIYLSEANKYISLRSPTLTTYVLEKFNSQGGLEGSVNVPIPSPELNVRSLACSISMDDDPSKCLVAVASKEVKSSPWVFNFIIVEISSMTVQGQRGIDLGGRYANDSDIGDFDIKYSGGLTVVARTQAGEENEIAVLEGGSVISKIPQRHGITKCCIFNGSIYGLSTRTILNGDFFDVYKFNIDLDEINSYRLLSISYGTPKFQFPCLNSDGRFITHAVREATPESPSGVAVNAQVYNEGMINIGSYKRNDEVIKSSTKRKYRCAVDATFDDPELGVNLSTPTWVDVGAANRWMPFDRQPSQQAVSDNPMYYKLKPGEFVRALSVFNISSVSSVNVKVTDPVDGVIYDRDFYLVDNSNVVDMWTYLTLPISFKKELIITDLVCFRDSEIEITLTGENPAVGAIFTGNESPVGRCVTGTGVRSNQFSIRKENGFGGFDIIQRGVGKIARFRVAYDISQIDYITNLLESIDSQYCVFIGELPNDKVISIYGILDPYQSDFETPTINTLEFDVLGVL